MRRKQIRKQVFCLNGRIEKEYTGSETTLETEDEMYETVDMRRNVMGTAPSRRPFRVTRRCT